MPPRFVDVLVPVALDHTYSYRVPEGMVVEIGDLVAVPLGPRAVMGAVWATDTSPEPRLHNRLKDIEDKLDTPAVRPALRRFVDWLADYTLTPRGMVLRMALRMGELGTERERVGVRLSGQNPQRMTPARRRVLDLLSDGMARGKGDAAREAGVSPGVVSGLIDEGVLETLVLRPSPDPLPDPDFAAPSLSKPQGEAAETLRNMFGAGFAVALLDGVTGSGKTEVYFEAVAQAIRTGAQVLILLPEIALTAQFLDRFAERFGVRPAEWHSQIAPRARARLWAGVADGSTPVVVGARSALFLPFSALGLVIVDEEHDGAYKQEDGPRYHARDMAIVRAREEGVPVVLASATPSVETEVNARRGRYARLVLPSRYGGQTLPTIETIDLRREGPPRGRFIAPRLEAAVRDAIEAGEQALLFLNRRGFAPLTLCNACGHRLSCPNCDAWLVDHRFRRRLVCHHCGFARPLPEKCPKCEATESFVAVGPGVERLEQEAAALFPDARILVLSSDMVESVERLRAELDDVADGKFDLIVGTQLVAKGHHFPKLNLVGIVDADLGLANGDPRASERSFQLLNQVVGRAGREAGRGRGLLQTHQPDHPVMRALIAQDRTAFYDAEIATRERAAYPPFGRLASVVLSGADKHATEAFARDVARAAPHDEAIRVLGPAEAPLALVRGRYRFRLLVKAGRGVDLSAYLRQWLAAAPKPRKTLKLEVDVDPQSFL